MTMLQVKLTQSSGEAIFIRSSELALCGVMKSFMQSYKLALGRSYARFPAKLEVSSQRSYF